MEQEQYDHLMQLFIQMLNKSLNYLSLQKNMLHRN